MTVMALAALASWNALSLDARDIAIPGPLPIERRTIVRAKLASVVIVAGGAAIVLNAVTSVLFPLLVVAKLPIGFVDTGKLLLAHALVALSAGAFGFLAVLAVRELLHAALGTARFMRVSVPVHATLTVAGIASLLLLPGLSSGVAQRWLVEPAPLRWRIPPLWFVSLHEYLCRRHHEWPSTWRAAPLGRGPGSAARDHLFQRTAGVRRAGFGRGDRAGRHGHNRPAGLLVEQPAHRWSATRCEQRRPNACRPHDHAHRECDDCQASGGPGGGPGSACRCVVRSLPHRISMATSAAVAIAFTIILPPFVASAGQRPDVPVLLLAPQVVAVIAVVIGSSRDGVTRGPAGQLGVPRRVAGRCAALCGGEAEAVCRRRRDCPHDVAAGADSRRVPLGLRGAGAHALLGTLRGAVLLQVATLGAERLPLACAYTPSGTLKTRGPVYLFAGIAAVYWIGWLERAALASPRGIGTFVAIALTLYAALGFIASRQADLRSPGEVEEPVQENTQRLGLTGA